MIECQLTVFVIQFARLFVFLIDSFLDRHPFQNADARGVLRLVRKVFNVKYISSVSLFITLMIFLNIEFCVST